MQDAHKGESIAETMGFTKKPHFPLAMTVILCYNISYIIRLVYHACVEKPSCTKKEEKRLVFVECAQVLIFQKIKHP